MPRRAFPDPGSWYFHLIEEKIAPEGDVTEQWKVASKAFTHSLLSRTLAKPMVSHVRHAGPFVASYLFVGSNMFSIDKEGLPTVKFGTARRVSMAKLQQWLARREQSA